MNIPAKRWSDDKKAPKRILAIRTQGMGDVVITLPYLQYLRHALPSSVRLDFLTREETDPIPRNIHLFDRVYSIGGGRRYRNILLHTFLVLPRLLLRRYDVVLDLQNNLVSEIVRKAVRPKAWAVFDKVSPVAAGERTRLTIEAAGLGSCAMMTEFRLKGATRAADILKRNGWNGTDRLVVLNPAGLVETRNWPLQNYIRFARLWLHRFPATQFVVLGTTPIKEKGGLLKAELGMRLLNLADQTSPVEAFDILLSTALVLTEDSGLMHMSWISGVPTMALFGSTRSDWSRPLGPHSKLLDSSDLPCGNCLQSICRWGDVRCLTRYSPERVFNEALSLIGENHRIKQAGG